MIGLIFDYPLDLIGDLIPAGWNQSLIQLSQTVNDLTGFYVRTPLWFVLAFVVLMTAVLALLVGYRWMHGTVGWFFQVFADEKATRF